MTSTTTSSRIVVDQPLVEAFLSLQRAAIDAEAENARMAAGITIAGDGTPDDEFKSVLKEMAEEINDHLDRLMVARLVEGRRNVPVLRLNDVDRVLQQMLEGEKLDENGLAMMKLCRPLVELGIATRLATFGAIDANTQDAFWRFGKAIVNEALTSSLTPARVVRSQEGRIAVYRQIMTPESWRALNRTRIANMSGVAPSTILGAVTGTMSESAATDLEKHLATIDDASAAERVATAKRIGAYYTTLRRKIWPTHKQA